MEVNKLPSNYFYRSFNPLTGNVFLLKHIHGRRVKGSTIN
jgi:hypothetical protein